MLWKESLNSDGHQFCQYQQNKQSPLILTELTEHKKTPRHMKVEILAWDRHKHVEGLNLLMGSFQHFRGQHYWRSTFFCHFVWISRKKSIVTVLRNVNYQKKQGPSWLGSYGSWKLSLQSVPITTDVVSSNLDQGEVYNIMW